MINELLFEGMWKEEIMAYFVVLFLYIPGETEENYE
jgi:hypothetical protein